MPPEASGVADYTYALLETMVGQGNISLTAVVQDGQEQVAQVPHGVRVVSATDVQNGIVASGSINVYHIGNNWRFHGWMIPRVIKYPGILVLHDPSLYDLHHTMLQPRSPQWDREWEFNGYTEQAVVQVDGAIVPDRTHHLFVRRLIEASLTTVVHSQWAQTLLSSLYPSADIRYIPLGVVLPEEEKLASYYNPPTISVVGTLVPHVRIQVVAEAFARIASEIPDARMVILGRRSDESDAVLRLRLREHGITRRTKVIFDAPGQRFDWALRIARLVVCLRWPTAGGTSAVAMRAFGAGRPVLTSDIPQMRELDPAYCIRIPTGGPEEVDAAVGAMRWALTEPDASRRSGEAARQFVQDHASMDRVAQLHTELIGEYVGAQSGTLTQDVLVGDQMSEADAFPGVNVIGDWAATTGLAEAGRRLTGALRQAGVPLSARNAASGAPRDETRVPQFIRRLSTDRSFAVDLWTINVDQFSLIPDDQLRVRGRSSYAIGTWYWELPTFPERVLRQIDRVDEIWVATHYVQNNFRRVTHKPVHIVPAVVPELQGTGRSRRDFSLPEDRVIFLFSFDVNSTIARKNPGGVVRAFTRAFHGIDRERVCLVLKVLNLDRHPDVAAWLQPAVAEMGGILLDDDLSQGELVDLFLCSDVYVSLHRAEGFGLGMAECMSLGKPVIATAFSGNLDFTRANNSCQVGYRARPITNRDYQYNQGIEQTYHEGAVWAEPNLDQAAVWMRRLASDKRLRESIGRAGQKTIREHYSESVVGAVATQRLVEIERQHLISKE